jgi:hypothetical protein
MGDPLWMTQKLPDSLTQTHTQGVRETIVPAAATAAAALCDKCSASVAAAEEKEVERRAHILRFIHVSVIRSEASK